MRTQAQVGLFCGASMMAPAGAHTSVSESSSVLNTPVRQQCMKIAAHECSNAYLRCGWAKLGVSPVALAVLHMTS